MNRRRAKSELRRRLMSTGAELNTLKYEDTSLMSPQTDANDGEPESFESVDIFKKALKPIPGESESDREIRLLNLEVELTKKACGNKEEQKILQKLFDKRLDIVTNLHRSRFGSNTINSDIKYLLELKGK